METVSVREGLTGLLREALENGRCVRVKARGGSMGRLIPDASVVEIAPISHAPRVGDVVAASKGEHLFIHRVVAVDAKIHLKGDARPNPDQPFDFNDILGAVKRVTTPKGWTVRLDTPSAAVVGNMLAWWSVASGKLRLLR